jgi:hypothetical protein
MKRYVGFLIVVLVLVGSSSCAARLQSTSSFVRDKVDLAILDRLSFGRAIPAGGGEVSDEDWAVFLNEVVTPRFPGGFVTWRTDGQWRNPSGMISHERGWVVEFNHADNEAADRTVSEIAAEYKRRFKQEAVFRVRYRVDASEI